MTRRQNKNQCSGGIAAHPTPPKKIPSAKIRWKSSRLDFWDHDGIVLIYYLPKGQTTNAEYYSSLLVRFEGKTPQKVHQGGSCSCKTMPSFTRHLQPRRNWPTWASNILITHLILRI